MQQSESIAHAGGITRNEHEAAARSVEGEIATSFQRAFSKQVYDLGVTHECIRKGLVDWTVGSIIELAKQGIAIRLHPFEEFDSSKIEKCCVGFSLRLDFT